MLVMRMSMLSPRQAAVRVEVLKALVAAGASPSAADLLGDTPLHAAVRQGHYGVLRVFLSKGGVAAPMLADLLYRATARGDLRMVELLILAGAPADTLFDGYAALHLAARYGLYGCVTALLQGGASPGVPSEHQRSTPLHLAVAHGHLSVVQLLLTRGVALVTLADANGQTPLHYAHGLEMMCTLHHAWAMLPSRRSVC
jgi:ankyrin repeat protein